MANSESSSHKKEGCLGTQQKNKLAFCRTESLISSNSSFKKVEKDDKSELSSVSPFSDGETSEIRTFTPKIIIWAENLKHKSKDYKAKKATVNRADCIRKRIKTHFNQFLLKHINNIVRRKFPSLSFGKLSQRFIADVKIDSNKKYLALPLKQILTMSFEGSKNQTNNIRVLSHILESQEYDILSVLNQPYFTFFEDYLSSDFYSCDLKKFQIKEGEHYTNLFKKYSFELVDYYKKGIPYKRRKFTSEHKVFGTDNIASAGFSSTYSRAELQKSKHVFCC